VPGYTEWVGWNATLPARTGKTRRRSVRDGEGDGEPAVGRGAVGVAGDCSAVATVEGACQTVDGDATGRAPEPQPATSAGASSSRTGYAERTRRRRPIDG